MDKQNYKFHTFDPSGFDKMLSKGSVEKKDLQSIIPCIITIRPKYDLQESIHKIMEFLPARYMDFIGGIKCYEKESPFENWADKVKHLHIKADEIYLTDTDRISYRSKQGVKYKRVKFGTLLSEYQRVKVKLDLELLKITKLNLLNY